MAGPLGLRTVAGWEVDLRAGEELYLRITNPDATYLPRLRVQDPSGSALVDEPPVDNSYTVQPERDGRYAVTVHNRRWGETAEWFVDVVRYSPPAVAGSDGLPPIDALLSQDVTRPVRRAPAEAFRVR